MEFEFDFAMCHSDFHDVFVPVYHEYPYPICIC